MSSLTSNVYYSKSKDEKVDWWLPGAVGREGLGLTANRYGVPVWGDGNVLELGCGNGCRKY